jgi:hypothetical protein
MLNPYVRFIDEGLAAGLYAEMQICQGTTTYDQRRTPFVHRTAYTPECPLITIEDPLDGFLGRRDVQVIAFELPLYGNHISGPECVP